MILLRVELGLCSGAVAVQVSPVSQVVSLLQDLHTKVSTEATAEVVASKPFSEWWKEKAQDDAH